MIGQRIRELRKSNRVRQTEMARALGITQPTLSRIEAGEIKASAELVQKAAKFLGVNPGDLLPSIAEPVRERELQNPARVAGHEGVRAEILRDAASPPGLRALAADETLIGSLEVRPAEWVALRALPLEGIRKEGYFQILMTLRAVMSA
jgi:transcriptional regulator with XRE-family HTH domain